MAVLIYAPAGESPVGFVKAHVAGSLARVSDSGSPGEVPGTCISSKSPGEAVG